MSDHEMKDTLKTICIVCLFVIVFILPISLTARYTLQLGTWKGDNFGVYSNRSYMGKSHFITELPEGAYDFRFQCSNFFVAADSYAGFTLKGADYDKFISYVINMNKKANRNNSHFVGKKVSETMKSYDDNGKYIGFPNKECPYVTDESIMDYTILYYNINLDSGKNIDAIISNSDTGRFIIIHSCIN